MIKIFITFVSSLTLLIGSPIEPKNINLLNKKRSIIMTVPDYRNLSNVAVATAKHIPQKVSHLILTTAVGAMGDNVINSHGFIDPTFLNTPDTTNLGSDDIVNLRDKYLSDLKTNEVIYLCSTPEFYALMEKNFIFEFIYRLDNGALFATTSISMKDCADDSVYVIGKPNTPSAWGFTSHQRGYNMRASFKTRNELKNLNK